MSIICACASPHCRVNGCQIARQQRIAGTLPPAPMKHHGCICPPGAEKTCQGLSCPRRNPFADRRVT